MSPVLSGARPIRILQAAVATEHVAVIAWMPGVGKTMLAAKVAAQVAATEQIFGMPSTRTKASM